jgi:hypothetical protein
VSIGRGQPRQVYRVYDEEDFLAAAQRPEEAPDRPETQLPAGLPADLTSGDAEMEIAMAPPLSGARRHSARPRLILAAGVAVIVFAAIEMHASVGRVTTPVPSRRPGLPGPKAARRSRRAVRSVAVDTRGSSRRPDQAGAAAVREHKLQLLTPAKPQPDASHAEGAAANAAATSSEFGFEQ